MLYLAPYVGQGTSRNPFQPAFTRLASGLWGAVDLRPDPSVQAGYCFAWIDSTADLSGDGLLQFGEDRGEQLTLLQRLRIANKLGIDLSATNTVEEVIREVLFTPDKPWKYVIPDRFGRKQVFLHGQEWAFKQVAVPRLGEIIDPSDDFNRANESPLAGNWTSVALPNSLQLIGNQVSGPNPANDACSYYNPFVPQNDQWCQIECGSLNGNKDMGPAVRIGTSGVNFYWLSLYSGDGGAVLNKDVGGAFSTIEVVSPPAGGQITVGEMAYIDVSGSTITTKIRGLGCLSSPSTDTSLTSGRAGMFMFEPDARIDNWQAGDLGGAPPTAAGFSIDFSTHPKYIICEREQQS